MSATNLVSLAEQINREHAAAGEAMRQSLQHAVRAGQLLMEAKAQLGHGEWSGWLEKHFHGSARTAQGYMRVATRLPELESKTQRVADLPLREALALLAEPKAEPLSAAADKLPSDLRRLHNELQALLVQAHAGGAHTALGYATWEEYGDAELVITPTSLKLPPNIPYEDWLAIGKYLTGMARAVGALA